MLSDVIICSIRISIGKLWTFTERKKLRSFPSTPGSMLHIRSSSKKNGRTHTPRFWNFEWFATGYIGSPWVISPTSLTNDPNFQRNPSRWKVPCQLNTNWSRLILGLQNHKGVVDVVCFALGALDLRRGKRFHL